MVTTPSCGANKNGSMKPGKRWPRSRASGIVRSGRRTPQPLNRRETGGQIDGQMSPLWTRRYSPAVDRPWPRPARAGGCSSRWPRPAPRARSPRPPR
jgi:hypothetical protein